MKKHPIPNFPSARRTGLILGKAAALMLLAGVSELQAGTFSSDFNSGLPAGTTLFGNASVTAAGGVTNSGCLQLTTATASQSSSFVITNELDPGQTIASFRASFKAYIGGGSGADGFSFNLASDIAMTGFGEDGSGSGLTIAFDTFNNGAPDYAGVGIRMYGVESYSFPYNGLRTGTFVDVVIQYHPDTTVDVIYDGTYICTNLYTGFLPSPGSLFALGSRTGGSTDNHWFDDIEIQTQTGPTAFLDQIYPVGRNVRADAPVKITLADYTTTVNPASIQLKLDGVTVVPTVAVNGPNRLLTYNAPALYVAGSTHRVDISFADSGANTSQASYTFTVAQYASLPSSLAVPDAWVATGNPGFNLRVSQIEDNLGPTIQRAEDQLAGLLIDPATGLAYANQATLTSATESGAINYALNPDQGNFPGDAPLPGLPATTGGTTNVALDAITYLHLNTGIYTLGVNSSDGFRLSAAVNADIFAPQESIHNGVRAAADSTVTFEVSQAGYYPFRIVYLVGGLEPVNPGSLSPSLEFFSIDASGERTLVNGTNAAGQVPVPAFTVAKTPPYIRAISPGVDVAGVPSASSITATLVDGTITVQPNSIQLLLNGVAVTPTVTTTSGITAIQYKPSTAFAPNSTNTVQLAFTDSSSVRRTNSWKFIAENILTQIWQILPASSTNATWAKWLTSGSTERGLAYNPKSGHVLIASRAAGAGTDGPGGLGVGILDGINGAYLGKLNMGDISTAPNGTFKLNMVDVADDGVIYGANLTTSGTVPFRIYRWQDESAAPQLVYEQNPADVTGATRCGDSFVVRGSGAGTEILASGNSAVTNVPIFTTVDGTNFTATSLRIKDLPSNSVRLGIAWGCGNDFYGATTATPLQYVGFNGAPDNTASRLATFDIRDRLAIQDIGPIGVDISNQRLIGNGTTGTTGNPHTMNLYDLPALTSAGTNQPIDFKTFPSANGNFGTGAIDFTPDGSRLYTLDTGNGIIAFSLAPKLAAPTICGQPRNHYVGANGMLGFMSVGAIGSPLRYQWRFNGVAIPNATSRTLDVPDVQTSKLGYYSAVVTNAMGVVTSAVAVLDTKMVVTSQPASQTVGVGASLNLSVVVSNGLPAYSYQWALNGANIAGATTASYSVPSAQVVDAGGYVVTVSDSLGQRISSQVAVVTVGTLGSGTGLVGDYFNMSTFATDVPTGPFAGFPSLSRIDPSVDFDWGITGSPDPSIATDYFTVRWHGQVQPLYSQTYTFYTRSDDGSLLWVNGELVVSSWHSQGPTERSGSIALESGRKYDVVMEYFERASGAVAQFSWSSPSQYKGIVPMTQLYPGAGPLTPRLTSTLQNGTNIVLKWMGTANLESSTNVAGPYTTLQLDAQSPITIAPGSEPVRFFRVLSQQAQ